jgi:predicted secreted protein
VPDNPEPGHATSAPQNPMMWRKALATTLIAAVLWGIAYWLIESELLSLRPPRGV